MKTKTREITFGYYDDLEEETLHYNMMSRKEDGSTEPFLKFFDGNSFYIGDIEIVIREAITKSGKRILTMCYEFNGKHYSVPLYNEFNGRLALTEGALANGILHYDKPLNKLQQALIKNDISTRCIRYVKTIMELDLIYSNMHTDEISDLFKAYLKNNRITSGKLIPKEYKNSIILSISKEGFEIMKSNGFLIVEKRNKKDNRIKPSMIFITKEANKPLLIEYINKRYSDNNEE